MNDQIDRALSAIEDYNRRKGMNPNSQKGHLEFDSCTKMNSNTLYISVMLPNGSFESYYWLTSRDQSGRLFKEVDYDPQLGVASNEVLD